MIAWFQSNDLTGDFERRSTFDEQHPLVLGLFARGRGHVLGADDALDVQVTVAQQCVEALAAGRRCGVVSQVAWLDHFKFFRLDVSMPLSSSRLRSRSRAASLAF